MSSRALWVPAGVSLRDFLADPVRAAQLAATLVVLGYGTRPDFAVSPLTFSFMEPLVGGVFGVTEILLFSVGLLEVVRRVAISDYRIDRSPISRSALALLIVAGLIPFARMLFHEMTIRLPFELLFLPIAMGAFFMWKMAYRREELPTMVWIFVACGVYKLFEGVLLYLKAPIAWGLLTSWRDAMLITMMVLGGLFALVIPASDGDREYRRLRTVFILLLPLSIWITMLSMRRSFMLAAMASLPALLYFLPRRLRIKAGVIAVCVVVTGMASLIISGDDSLLNRLTGITEPTTEGSAAYRLLESYNTLQMVYERPIFGWPMATMTRNYTNIEYEIVSSIMPHNIYLYVALRSGIIGLGVYLWFLGAICLTAWRVLRSATTPMERFLSLWLGSAVILMVIAGMFTPLLADRNQYLLPFVLVMLGYLPGAFGPPKGVSDAPEVVPQRPLPPSNQPSERRRRSGGRE